MRAVAGLQLVQLLLGQASRRPGRAGELRRLVDGLVPDVPLQLALDGEGFDGDQRGWGSAPGQQGPHVPGFEHRFRVELELSHKCRSRLDLKT